MAMPSDEELERAYRIARIDEWCTGTLAAAARHAAGLRAVVALVVERLAGDEDVKAIVADAMRRWRENCGLAGDQIIADAIREALAQQAARWDRQERRSFDIEGYLNERD